MVEIIQLIRIKKIIILTLDKNLGSQKAISVGLDYLKKKKKKIILLLWMVMGKTILLN